MASAIPRAAAAAAAALRRAATLYPAAGFRRFAGIHRAVPHEPPFPRFSRPRQCYRTSGPDEQEEYPSMEELEGMDRETLLQYAKRVSMDKQALLKRSCRYGIESDMNMKDMKEDIKNVSSRLDALQQTVESRRDMTSFSIRKLGSINVFAVGVGALTIYQVCSKFF